MSGPIDVGERVLEGRMAALLIGFGVANRAVAAAYVSRLPMSNHSPSNGVAWTGTRSTSQAMKWPGASGLPPCARYSPSRDAIAGGKK